MNEISKKNTAIVENLECGKLLLVFIYDVTFFYQKEMKLCIYYLILLHFSGIRKCFSVKNVSNGFTKNAFAIPMCLNSYSVIDFLNLYARYVLEPLKK